jgi:hypothetical protein
VKCGHSFERQCPRQRRDQGRACASMTRGATWDGMPPAARCAVAPDLVAAHVAGNDPPLIRVRAATRGRCTTEGDERGGAKRRYPFALQPRNRSARLRSTTTADGATRDAPARR